MKRIWLLEPPVGVSRRQVTQDVVLTPCETCLSQNDNWPRTFHAGYISPVILGRWPPVVMLPGASQSAQQRP